MGQHSSSPRWIFPTGLSLLMLMSGVAKLSIGATRMDASSVDVEISEIVFGEYLTSIRLYDIISLYYSS
jgi:hypothetical protein